MNRFFIFMILFLTPAISSSTQIFGDAIPVDTTTPGVIYQWQHDIAVDSDGNVGVVWINQISGNDIVMFAKSTEGGQTWQKTVVDDSPLEGPGDARYYLSLAFNIQNNPWVVWHYYQDFSAAVTYVARSSDGGESFTAPFFKQDTFEMAVRSIAIDENSNVYIPWMDSGLNCVTFLEGNPDNWISVQINPDTLQPYNFPKFYAKGTDTLFCAWLDKKSWPTTVLYFSRSFDHGLTFSAPVLVSSAGIQGTYGQQGVSISVDNQGVIYLTWADDRTGDYDIYFSKSFDNGNIFTESQRVNNRVEGSQPDAENSNNSSTGICVAWLERDSQQSNDIYFSRSIDAGSTFSNGILIGGEQHQALYQGLGGIATNDSGNVYIAFTDKRLGIQRLFVTKATFESTSVLEQSSNSVFPEFITLQQNYPNPFNVQTAIEYNLPADSYVTVNVYNILGEKVRTLIRASASQGLHKAVWDGRNDQGNLVSSGVYLYKLETLQSAIVKKLVLLR